MVHAQSFPRHSARTQGFTLGEPRNVTIAPSGDRVIFLRSSHGTDRSHALWALDLHSGSEQLIADPAAWGGEQTITAEERARRERARERGAGITGYASDRAVRRVTFALSGRLFLADVDGESEVRELPAQQPVADPKLDPAGQWIAYVSGGALRVIGTDGTDDHALAEPEHDNMRWGVAEFIAAEEMGRSHGYWWSPDGSVLLAARVDESPVQRWFLGDPAEPSRPPATLRYPAAGTANADVRLSFLGLDGSRVDVTTDVLALPYLVAAHWSPYGPPLIALQSRDQRSLAVFTVDPQTGCGTEIHRETDAHWVEIKHGWPAWTPDQQLVRISADGDSYRLVVGGRPWTPPRLQVRAVLDVDANSILISASEDDPTEIHVYRVGADDIERISPSPGIHSARRTGAITILSSSDLDSLDTRLRVFDERRELAEIRSHADTPDMTLRIELLKRGARDLHSALLLPTGYRASDGKLPVLLDPYGGPQAQRVLARQRGYLTSQWFAEQGFAVVVTDGRGTGGRGPGWDRAVAGDLAGVPLEDQIDALHALAAQRPELDLDRVAIRGWSFGGYLAALAVLRRPDVFHAAIAGAPVCDWSLYDTHYTERYLGVPDSAADIYEANSVVRDAAKLARPLLIVHGTVDDNVVPAHSLRLSAALTAAARPHTMLLLPGVSHAPTDETTNESLLLLQVDFLRNALNDQSATAAR